VQKLEKEILDIIKKKFVLSINNIEMLQSELYILSKINVDNKNVLECERQIKEIKSLLKRINKIKEQYDFLKDNYDFEIMTKRALEQQKENNKKLILVDKLNSNERK